MRVVIAHTDFRLYWPARLRAFREFLTDRDVELRVLELGGNGSPYDFSRDGDREIWWEVVFPEANLQTLAPRRASQAIFSRLDQLDPDVVVAGAIAFYSGAASVRWARLRQRGIVIMDDARRCDVPRSRLVNHVKRRIYRNVDAVFLPAPSHQADFEFWGLSPQRMYYGVNAADNDFWSSRFADGPEQPTPDLGLKTPRPYFLGVGRQIVNKNWSFLLKAYAEYRRQCAGPWSLLLIGGGPEHHKLVDLARSLEIPSVYFLPFQPPNLLRDYYRNASAVVFSSLGEPWGLVINEAMACGKPVLVSRNCGCASTLVLEGQNGWTFNPTDERELTGRMLDLSAASHSDMAAMGRRSCEIVSAWGIDRFCHGLWDAILSCSRSTSRSLRLADRILLHLWNGRYRPI